MSILTDLQEARELILKEENWTQEVFARDATGDKVSPTSEEACQWCALGALTKIAFPNGRDEYATYRQYCERYGKAHLPLQDAAHYLYATGVSAVNDKLTHAEVLKMYDKSIDFVKGQV